MVFSFLLINKFHIETEPLRRRTLRKFDSATQSCLNEALEKSDKAPRPGSSNNPQPLQAPVEESSAPVADPAIARGSREPDISVPGSSKDPQFEDAEVLPERPLSLRNLACRDRPMSLRALPHMSYA